MQMAGTHLMVEMSGCDPAVLGDAARVREALMVAAQASRAHVLEVFMHQFQPTGVSGIVALEESHLSVHTWPECAYAAVDIYTCGDHTMPHQAAAVLAQALGAQDTHLREVCRGVERGPGRYVSEAVEPPPPLPCLEQPR
jgi:S-adenosylmethionine decarboxylase